MDPYAFVDTLRADPDRAGSLLDVREFPAIDPVLEPFPPELPELLTDRVGLLGVEGLYPHQARALRILLDGGNVALASGTASGKTLSSNLAFATAALEGEKATALYLYPTKALARDQLRQVRALKLPQLRAAVYDGDTPRAERPLIRRNANLVLTNPDMLHASMLPDHARWADFFLRLSLVVIDEAHTARGVFGTHVAMVLRRLRRLVAHYGGTPRFALASATIGNPAELAGKLLGLPCEAVTDEVTPRGEKLFVLWNPPVVDEESGQRRSALSESADLIASLVSQQVRTIGFTRSRKAAELLATFAQRAVGGGIAKESIKAYRAGYLPEQRRELERQLADGELTAIASTNALELGIDIGSLDAAVLVGYPGTRASMWQQAGRAGRRGAGSLAVLVAQDDPLDQYLVHHPSDLFDRRPEAAVIDPENPFVLQPHLLCAAREAPLLSTEVERFFGRAAVPAVERLVEEGSLKERSIRGGGTALHHRGTTSPHRGVDIRSASGHVFSIVVAQTGELLGTVDEARAYGQVHAGAVYLHQGEQYLVTKLDLVERVAVVEPGDPDFYTQSRDVTDLRVVEVLRQATSGEVPVSYGSVDVTNQVVGYVRKLVATGETMDVVPLAFLPQTLQTRAVWWAIPHETIERAAISPADLPGAAHAAEHAAIGLLPLVATCDRWDVGGVSTALHPDTGSCAIFIYDGYPGGAGIAERGFTDAERLLRATLATVRECSCSRGCPSCVQSPKCGNGNEPLDKAGAVSLLAAIVGETWG
ncbi:MAG: DEAD/DEAH box helicase [Actinomycetota bacterium]